MHFKHFKPKPSQAAISNALALMSSKNEHFNKLIKTFELVETPTDSDIQTNKQTIKNKQNMKTTTKTIAKPASAAKTEVKTEKAKAIFADGLLAFKPNAKAAEFVLAEVLISVARLETFINENPQYLHEHAEYGQQLKLQLKKNDADKLYFVVNTYGLDK